MEIVDAHPIKRLPVAGALFHKHYIAEPDLGITITANMDVEWPSEPGFYVIRGNSERYPLPITPPIQVPTNVSLAGDAYDQGLVDRTLAVKEQKLAIDTLIEFVDTMLKPKEPHTNVPGIGRLFISPYCEVDTIELARDNYDHITTEGISQLAYRMLGMIAVALSHSGYSDAHALRSPTYVRPRVVVVGSAWVVTMLTNIGLFSTKNNSKVNVVFEVADDERLDTDLYMVFQRQRDDIPELSFGAFGYSDIEASLVELARGGALVKSFMISRRQRHVVTCPIAMRLSYR